MAAPNLISATTINGKVAVVSPANTSANLLLSNAGSSGHCYRVVSLMVSNLDTVICTVTVNYYATADNSGTARPICNTMNINPNSTEVIIAFNAPLYMEEATSLYVTAGTASKLTAICSYEDIS